MGKSLLLNLVTIVSRSSMLTSPTRTASVAKELNLESSITRGITIDADGMVYVADWWQQQSSEVHPRG